MSEPLKETPEGVTFEDLGLNPALLDAVKDMGYSNPTPIQWRAIPEVLKGKDILGIAQTGTGKTASFVLPAIEILSQGRAKARMPRTIILEPTRELAAQVAENFEQYGKNHKLSMALLIGGVSFGDQDALLMKGVDVLIATPGRLLDHFERGKILMSGVQLLVIDEADRMLDMGFMPDIEKILKITPFTRQTLLFSATMPPEIEGLANQFLHAPTRIEVARPNQTASTIEQFLIKAKYNDAKQKRAILRNIMKLESESLQNAIVFCNRKRDVDIVAKSLTKHGFPASPIHGDLQQSKRMETLDKFKSGELKTLVASDVAARGIDIPEVSHVFNYDVPSHSEDYVHRIGRTGRAGRNGKTFMIATPYDDKALDAVIKLIKNPIDEFADNVGQNDEPAHLSAKRPNKPRLPINNQKEQKSEKPYDKPYEKSYDKPKYDNNKKFRNEKYSKNNEEEIIIGFGDLIPAFMSNGVAEKEKAEQIIETVKPAKTTTRRTKKVEDAKSETKKPKATKVTKSRAVKNKAPEKLEAETQAIVEPTDTIVALTQENSVAADNINIEPVEVSDTTNTVDVIAENTNNEVAATPENTNVAEERAPPKRRTRAKKVAKENSDDVVAKEKPKRVRRTKKQTPAENIPLVNSEEEPKEALTPDAKVTDNDEAPIVINSENIQNDNNEVKHEASDN